MSVNASIQFFVASHGRGRDKQCKEFKTCSCGSQKRLFSKMKRTDLDYPSFFSLTWSVKLFWPFSIVFFPPSTTLVDKAAGAKELFLEQKWKCRFFVDSEPKQLFVDHKTSNGFLLSFLGEKSLLGKQNWGLLSNETSFLIGCQEGKNMWTTSAPWQLLCQIVKKGQSKKCC